MSVVSLLLLLSLLAVTMETVCLRVDLTDWDNATAYALYDIFYIDGPDRHYRLHVADYSGTAEWTSSSLPDGSRVETCVGETASFRWEYTASGDETVTHIEYYKITQDGKRMLATYVAGHLLKFPSVPITVGFLPNAGVEIGNFTWDDFTVYHITINYRRGDTPVLAANRLVASIQPEPVTDVTTGQRHVQLSCGQFLNLGGRQISVIWRAFDSVDREALWKLLRHYGVPGKIISLIQCTYKDMSCRIAHAGQLSESFEVKTGVRQGCLLSPFLFLLVIDWIMKTTTTGRKNGIQWTLWTQLDDLDFADDLALLSHSHSQMQDKTTCLEATSAGTGLKINRRKTELMKINTTANTPVTVGGEFIREVESFVYLGSVVDGQGGTDRDVTARIGKARAAMVMLKNIWASKVVSIRTKLRIFNSNVKSVLLYGCETWRTTKTMQQKIQTFLNTCLRRIFNIRWPEKIRNEELWERAGQEPASKQILRRKWGWIGHTLRKPASSTTRQALTWNPQGKRKRGRPRNSWRRDTEAELYKQGTNWTGVARIAQNRVRWRRVVDGLCSTWSQGPK
nr:hypothetical protein BaRGS_033576 [Batillaria attramentaria]